MIVDMNDKRCRRIVLDLLAWAPKHVEPEDVERLIDPIPALEKLLFQVPKDAFWGVSWGGVG